jgi:hypothetical protein
VGMGLSISLLMPYLEILWLVHMFCEVQVASFAAVILELHFYRNGYHYNAIFLRNRIGFFLFSFILWPF